MKAFIDYLLIYACLPILNIFIIKLGSGFSDREFFHDLIIAFINFSLTRKDYKGVQVVIFSVYNELNHSDW